MLRPPALWPVQAEGQALWEALGREGFIDFGAAHIERQVQARKQFAPIAEVEPNTRGRGRVGDSCMRQFSTAASDQGILPDRLDIKAFAQAGGHLSGRDSLLKYERLAQEAKGLHPDLLVDWKAVSEIRLKQVVQSKSGFHLSVHASFPWNASAASPRSMSRWTWSVPSGLWQTKPRPKLWMKSVMRICWL